MVFFDFDSVSGSNFSPSAKIAADCGPYAFGEQREDNKKPGFKRIFSYYCCKRYTPSFLIRGGVWRYGFLYISLSVRYIQPAAPV